MRKIEGISIGIDATDGWFGDINAATPDRIGSAAAVADEWVHLAFVRDNGTAAFYVNGVNSGTSSTTPTAGSYTHMAVNPGGVDMFGGNISQVRIFTFDAGEFSTSDLLYPAIPEPGTAGLVLGMLAIAALRCRLRR